MNALYSLQSPCRPEADPHGNGVSQDWLMSHILSSWG
jgi:hypothetical protein